MERILQACCGLDVHKKSVMACRKLTGENGKTQSVVRKFGTVTREHLALADWLAEGGVTDVAMESTGVFWKPVWNILESAGFKVILVNAHHVKQVPGRKTDVKDCEWLAQLLQHGLLRSSFVPPRPIRELRDLTRHRTSLIQDKTSVINRIHKVLQDANIKLSSVASDIMGVSGRAMLTALVDGETNPETLADMARSRLRGKIPQLRLALEGHVTGHHRFMLKTLLAQLEQLEKLIESMDERIAEVIRPFERKVQLLATAPGLHVRAAQNVIAELGTEMEQFPSSAHLASWAGACPGNNESAGKRKSGKTTKGSVWLRRTLVEAALAASRTKDTYPQAQYRRLVGRRGKKRALVAVAHSLLVAIYHMLKTDTPYRDLGPKHFDQLDPARLTRYHVKRLESLGHKVTLEPTEQTAA